MKTIYLAGGCFWSLEEYLRRLPGVISTEVGYANGTTENPTYEDVCRRRSGHTQTVKVAYDPAKISLVHLLNMFLDVIDPFSFNRQGNDHGPQYRSGIYYTEPADEATIRKLLQPLGSSSARPLAVEVLPLVQFAKAEEYHQSYLKKHPDSYCHIEPQAFEKASRAIVDPGLYPPISKDELRRRLSPEQYRVVCQDGTEAPYVNIYNDHFEPGIYIDIATGEPLFSSRDKFEGDGWPSFSQPIDPSCIRYCKDRSAGLQRQEVRSRSGNSHLGHVFQDGPEDRGGLRYCINSAALRFIPKEEMAAAGYEAFLPYV